MEEVAGRFPGAGAGAIGDLPSEVPRPAEEDRVVRFRWTRRVWKKEWVVHCEPVGSGEAAFKYLAPYVFRVAISNSRIVKLEGRVTFKYKDSATDQLKFATVSAEEFIRRFLQHVLPERFVKVRYYGLVSPGNRALLKRAQALGVGATGALVSEDQTSNQRDLLRCPNCGSEMKLIGKLSARGQRAALMISNQSCQSLGARARRFHMAWPRLDEQQSLKRHPRQGCVRSKMKSSKWPPDPSNGKLPERASRQREVTESARVADYEAPDQSPSVVRVPA